MRRITRAVLIAVCLLPTSSAAQTASLSSRSGSTDLFLAGPTTYAPTYDRLPSTSFPQYYNTGGYYPSGWQYPTSRELSPTSRYMARGMHSDYQRSYYEPDYRRTYYGANYRRTYYEPVYQRSYYEPVYQRSYYEPGRLRLDVVPSQARVYVDGTFIGTVHDVNYRRGGYAVSPGAHYVSVRASGYQLSGASVWVPPGQSVTFRDYLDRERPTTRYVSPYIPLYLYSPYGFSHPRVRYVVIDVNPASSDTATYVIPGCFAGDAPPRPEKLRPGCKLEDLKRVYH